MVKLKSLIKYLTFSSLILFGCLKEGNKKTEGPQKLNIKENVEVAEAYPEIFDSLENKFIEKLGGIEEKIINKNIKIISPDKFWIYKMVDSSENYSNFNRLKNPEQGSASNLGTMFQIVKNFQILEDLERVKIGELEEEYLPLKKLMIQLDSLIKKDKKLDYSLFKKAYELIGEQVKPSYNHTDLSIHKVIAGKGGVCRDMVSTFYPLLIHYGFNVGFKRGIADGEEHIWLCGKIDDSYFEIDPSWYKEEMIPLEERIKNDLTYCLKED